MPEDQADINYARAVSNGHYDVYTGGLSGKHDNVRSYWEDQIRGMTLRPHVLRLVDRRRRADKKVRIVDLGSGTGEGLRLLSSWRRAEEDLRLHRTRVLPHEVIDCYIGCDLCQAMVDQGNVNFADSPNVTFRQGDFSEGFPLTDEEPFDLYFSTYGSFSHIDDEAMERLLTEIVEHAGPRALVVGDWLGRHSIEWPCYWGEPGDQMLSYSMNWLPSNGPGEEADQFPMRFWLGDEIRSLVARVAEKTKARVMVLGLYDCSVFVGRHMDTGQYNQWTNPVRAAVNRLHEQNVRTDLETVKVHLASAEGHDELNRYYARLRYCWNNLVDYCQRRLEKGHHPHPVRLRDWQSFPPALQIAIMTLDRVIDTVAWMRMGDPRANIIEPQLGYALRNLELESQTGLGRGHALIGVLEIRKDADGTRGRLPQADQEAHDITAPDDGKAGRAPAASDLEISHGSPESLLQG